jgi:hypothetical protein
LLRSDKPPTPRRSEDPRSIMENSGIVPAVHR